MDYKIVEKCRVCKSIDLKSYINLGNLPLANNYVDGKNITVKSEKSYPLNVLFCEDCGLSQLSIVVDPKIMFTYYSYRSSVSKSFIIHCENLVNSISSRFSKDVKDWKVVDIASNDGCLLQVFKENGSLVLGVEPAINIAKMAEKNGISTINDFWNKDAMEKVRQRFSTVDVITATNVFAHVDDIQEFVKLVKEILSSKGYFVIEVPYFDNFFSHMEFDTIYHEHLSYFLLSPMCRLFEQYDLQISSVEKVDIHGGSIRVFVQHKGNPIDSNVKNILEIEKEKGYFIFSSYKSFFKRVKEVKKEFLEILKNAKEKGLKVIGYGAPAKGNTLLCYFGVGTELIEYLIDDTPEKQNTLAPGSHIPIVDNSYIINENEETMVVILPWNFRKEIIKKAENLSGKKFKYIIPIPKPIII